MKLDNYRLLKIPFVSKKKSNEILGIKDNRPKYSFHGNAYYIVDTKNWWIIWERAVLLESEYRPTDPDMKKRKHYIKHYINKQIDREEIMGWSNENKIVKLADAKMLRKINEHAFMHTSTVLGIEGVITGSNPSGADKKMTSTPLLINPLEEQNYVRFVNAIKMIRKHNKIIDTFIKEQNLDFTKIEKLFNQITIKELMKKNLRFNKWMKIINSDIGELKCEEHNQDVKSYLDEIKNNDFRNSISHTLLMYEKKLIDEKKTIEKLRREFKVALLKEASENDFKSYTGNNDFVNDILDLEAAHILDVSKIKNKKLDFNWIADPNNGLLLDANTHTIFDKNKIVITEEGKFISKDNNYKNINLKILDDVMNDERKKFIKLRNEHL